MATPSDALRVAAAELGYCRFDDPQEGTKFGRWYAQQTGASYFGASGVPFCAMGASWVLDQIGMTPPGGIFAYVPTGINQARSAGASVEVHAAVPGDLVCFDWDDDGVADHVAFVEANRGTYLQTIEFNTTGPDGRSGSVARRTRYWSDVQAVLRPAYSGATGGTVGTGASVKPAPAAPQFRDITGVQSAVHVTADNVSGPDTRRAVDAVRKASRWGGGLFPYGVRFTQACVGTPQDGVWGPNSRSAHDATVSAIQRAVGAAVDGVWGPETESKTVAALTTARQA